MEARAPAEARAADERAVAEAPAVVLGAAGERVRAARAAVFFSGEVR
jgi:hypothetical protein